MWVSSLHLLNCEYVIHFFILGNTHPNILSKGTSHLQLTNGSGKQIWKMPNKDFLLSPYLSLSYVGTEERRAGTEEQPHTAVQGCLEKKPTHIAFGHWVWLGGYQVCLLGKLPISSLLNCPLGFLACSLTRKESLSLDTPMKHLLSPQ